MTLRPSQHVPDDPIRVAITGAHGAYGRTLLAQLTQVPGMTATVLVDPDLDGTRAMAAELGATGAEVVDGPDAVAWDRVDVLVEATGRVGAGVAYARAAMAHRAHVVMVSKEVETVAGVGLAREAADRGLRYLPGDGDQPAAVVALADRLTRLGLEIVALGKAGEYDLVLDPATGGLTQQDTTIDAPELVDLLALGDDPRETLRRRERAVAPLTRRAAADHCEMTVVAQYTAALPDREDLHYPVCRPGELADVYSEREHGGILSRAGSSDVFSPLRLPGEASFAGGVFAVVRTGDPVTWRILEGKGHVVSRDGRYACIYWPYHLMGVETPLTIAAAVAGHPLPAAPAAHAVLAARTTGPLHAGSTFEVAGHHHEIAGVEPVVRPPGPPSEDIAAFYLLDGARLVRDVPAGRLLCLDDLEGTDETATTLFRAARVGAGPAGGTR
jgi:predicted homoserine dehydrogenase-like protein